MEDIVVWIGTIAGILVLLSFIPQLMKAYKTKKMLDVSAHLMILIASGMFLWVIYGFIRSDPIIIGTNATGFALNATLLALSYIFISCYTMRLIDCIPAQYCCRIFQKTKIGIPGFLSFSKLLFTKRYY